MHNTHTQCWSLSLRQNALSPQSISRKTGTETLGRTLTPPLTNYRDRRVANAFSIGAILNDFSLRLISFEQRLSAKIDSENYRSRAGCLLPAIHIDLTGLCKMNSPLANEWQSI